MKEKMIIPDTMKALIVRKKGEYVLEEVATPVPQEGEILLHVEACGICAGDIKASHGTARFWGGDGMPAFCLPPFTPGHEFIGHIAAMGENVEGDFRVGDRIVSEQIVPCGCCWYCKRGMYWLCEHHDVYGFKRHLNGGMAEYVLLPKGSRNYRVPENLPLEQAVLIEPFACARHGVEQADIRTDDTVVLAGAGTLGLGMVNFIKLAHPRQLIVLDLNPERLRKAKEFGADIVLNPNQTDAIAQVFSLTEGRGCDAYIEATGHPAAVQQGLDMIRKGGRFVEFSVMSGPSTIDWSIIGDAKEITIQGSSLSPECFSPVITAIASGEVHTEGVVSHIFPLERWREAYEIAQTQAALKVVIVNGMKE